jgi:hypothetical protein
LTLLFRAGHAHAGVYLVLALVMLPYVDEAALPPLWKWIARAGAPIAAILIPAGFFLSVASTAATEPNGLTNLAYVGALFLAASWSLREWDCSVPRASHDPGGRKCVVRGSH